MRLIGKGLSNIHRLFGERFSFLSVRFLVFVFFGGELRGGGLGRGCAQICERNKKMKKWIVFGKAQKYALVLRIPL